MSAPKILVFSGSIRSGSVNTKLANAIANALPDFGGAASLVSLENFEMPIYNGDLEAKDGVPKAAKQFAELMAAHDGIVIVSPEYNAGLPALLKNTLDWVSRVKPEADQDLRPFKKPVFAIAGASPGAIGTLRNLTAMRAMLMQGFGALVIPEQLGVPNSHSAFDAEGNLNDGRPKSIMEAMLKSLVTKASALQEEH
ncbi:MAG: NADPH-dependent FMN reductase [Hyphomicrobiales bacterium]